MTNLPPMSGRAFRDYFMIDREPTFELDRPGGEDRKRGHFSEDDPYELCDFDDEESE